MIFRQLLDRESCTWTYLVGDEWSREAVLIDPVQELLDRDLGVLDELGLKLVYVLETHVHADHVTAAGLLRARTGAKVGVAAAAGVTNADLELADGDAIRFGLQAIEVRATPGHTAGCLTYVPATRPMAFTGDALFVRGCGRTDFQGGDPRVLYRSVRDKILSLPDETELFPAHDYKGRTVTTVREEKLYNPRLAGRTEDEFAAIMEGLGLPYPAKMDVAVPANLRCGLGEDQTLAPPAPSDDLIRRTAGGAPGIDPLVLAKARERWRLVDVREPEEWAGPDGLLGGAETIPLGELPKAAAGWSRDEPVALYCRSGGRSDRAARDLEALGFKRVASLQGGVLRWASLGLPLAGGGQG
jgi:sulfur dioxygenase